MRRQSKEYLVAIFICIIIYLKVMDIGHSCSESTDIDRMSALQLVKHIYRRNVSACRIIHDFGGSMGGIMYDVHLLAPYKVIDSQKSVCMDAKAIPKVNDCVVYSFGISNEWTFDEAVSMLGCHIYAFDPSMNATDHDHSPRIHFLKIGLGVADVEIDPVTGWKLMTLESIHKMLQRRHGDVDIDYLKIDIESAEWAVIPQIIRSGMMQRVNQMAVEIHFDEEFSADELKSKLKVLKSVEDAGMVPFAFRPNLGSEGDLVNHATFLAFELAWYKAKLHSTELRNVHSDK